MAKACTVKCTNCHQSANVAGVHTPPGNLKWQLPPADMKMVFEGRTTHQLVLQSRNYSQNGHKNKEQLLEHARDTLVKTGWTPLRRKSLATFKLYLVCESMGYVD